jgi:hypothetical protein
VVSGVHPADVIHDLGSGIVVLSMAGALAWSAHVLALRLCRPAPVSVRLGAAAIVAGWLMVAIFWATSPFLAFRPLVLAPLLILLASALHIAIGRQDRAMAQLGEDVRAAREALRALTRAPEGWLILAVASVALVRALRVAVSAPLAWDDLTYHLVKAARFVQEGGVVAAPAPAPWSYYELYPPAGDILWAWAMLPLRREALVPVMSALIWAVAVLGTFSCAREYGARREDALLATSAVCAMPAVLTYVGTGYVDNTVLASFVLAALFLTRLARGAPGREALLVGGALGVMLGSKLTTAPVMAMGVLALGWTAWRAGGRAWRWLLLAGGVAAAVALPSYVYAWIRFGSPVYPMPLTVAGRTLLHGHPLVTQHLESFPPFLRLQSPLDFWAFAFIRPGPWGEFNALGPGAILLFLLGTIGMPTALRQGQRMIGTLFLVASALIVTALVATSDMRFIRETVNVRTTGRYFTPPFTAAAIIGALAPASLVRVLCVPAVAAGILMSLPRAWAPVETILMAGGVAILLVVASASALTLIWASRSRRRFLPLLVILLSVSLALPWLLAVRQSGRYEIFAAAAARPPMYQLHPLNPIFAAAWPVWEALDQRGAQTIAVTAGWEIVGHHWYRYPLYGGRLQNQVIYVPITADGAIVEMTDMVEVQRRASFAAWLRRLVEARADYVVSLAPRTTVEDFWMRRTPGVFTPAYADDHGFHVAYRVDRGAAERMLRARGERAAPG